MLLTFDRLNSRTKHHSSNQITEGGATSPPTVLRITPDTFEGNTDDTVCRYYVNFNMFSLSPCFRTKLTFRFRTSALSTMKWITPGEPQIVKFERDLARLSPFDIIYYSWFASDRLKLLIDRVSVSNRCYVTVATISL